MGEKTWVFQSVSALISISFRNKQSFQTHLINDGLIYNPYIDIFLNPRLSSPLPEKVRTGLPGDFKQYGHHLSLMMKWKKWDSVTPKQVGGVLKSKHRSMYRNIHFFFCLLQQQTFLSFAFESNSKLPNGSNFASEWQMGRSTVYDTVVFYD